MWINLEYSYGACDKKLKILSPHVPFKYCRNCFFFRGSKVATEYYCFYCYYYYCYYYDCYYGVHEGSLHVISYSSHPQQSTLCRLASPSTTTAKHYHLHGGCIIVVYAINTMRQRCYYFYYTLLLLLNLLLLIHVLNR